ncbi:APC family permease [uncultured Kushneria sp.]|uniref:APC family permease n=1 Tax=uncultured Kushneria sp. TaxID=905033 RepID=UPI00261F1752|nr:APC family permease [uncultured Kushneria sp.]
MTDTSPSSRTLERTLNLPGVVIIGVAWVTPLIALATIGIIIELSNGTAPTAYLITLMAMIFTAWSYGRMALVHYQSAGSAYTYVGMEMGPRLGFLTGWLILLDYFFIPLVVWLIGAAYLAEQFPAIPLGIWIVAFIVPTTLLNIIGIQVAAKANYLLVAFQLLVIVILAVLSLAHFAGHETGATLLSPFFNQGTTFAALATAAVAAYSFIGFDGLTLLTEETHDPRRTIPRAMLIVVAFFGLLFVSVAWVAQLIHPGTTFANVDSAALELARLVGGNLFAAVLLAGLIIGQFACGLAIQAGASRLLFTMDRDGVLPKSLSYLSPRYKPPVVGIVLIGLTGLVGLFMDVTTSASFINFGAFSAFILVNLSTIMHYRRHRPSHGVGAILGWVVLPLAGAIVNFYLLMSLDIDARLIGGIWLALGVLWLAVLTRGFRQPPPRMQLEQADQL